MSERACDGKALQAVFGAGDVLLSRRVHFKRETIGGGRIASAGGNGLIAQLTARKFENRSPLRRENRKALRKLLGPFRRDVIDEAGDRDVEFAIAALVLRDSCRGSERRSCNHAAMLLQQHLQARRQRDVAEALALEAADGAFCLARKLNGSGGERVNHRQKQNDEAIELR